ncbi:type IX secretion system sortase PorU [Flavobacterium sp. MAH-1]|uniref:Type IX secretion system sortase PorU n=1 Tax=Flavobacterium agri TaxID=2743471 RepID=A0A7Y8Y194_9FLAO|nr:type IX secretion system sortase PorU [Flavobacterium agri]NUY80715.1 type IX secretion system sortase PorU [Flavobacterium agri]NYA70739.1 type IX secretion system sortase PorU [Flavobacterium agri]
MKKAVLFLIVFISNYCVAQQSGTATLHWLENSDYVSGEYKARIPQFDVRNMIFDKSTMALTYSLSIAQNGPVNPASLQITNLVYENLPASGLGDLKTSSIPTSVKTKLQNKNARDSYYAIITVSPIIKENGAYKKLVSFNYAFSSGNTSRPQTANTVNAITNSVLATGDWYRFYVEKSGVYKISKGFLQSLGMNTNVDPRKIKIYGNGGQMLRLRNSDTPSYDLEENAINFVGESDGQFDSGDYILFYAEGVDNWNSDSQTHINQFSDRSYYYVTAKGDNGKRIQETPQPASPTVNFTDFEDYQYHEEDKVNVVRLGRRWFGEQFNIENEQEFEFKFPGVVTSTPASIQIMTAAAAYTQTNFEVQSNGQTIGNIPIGQIFFESSTQAVEAPFTTSIPAAEEMTIKLTYNNNGVPGSLGYLDFIIIKARRTLKGYNKQYHFTANNSATSGVGQYQITNANNIPEVWDITDLYNATKFTNASQGSFSFNTTLGDTRKYVVLDNSDYYTPKKEAKSKVANQDIKGTIFKNQQGQFADVDYLIITPAKLSTQAEKLAAFHRSYSNLNVKVVTTEMIYQEFSSGKQDVAAIRNLAYYVYNNPSTPANRLKYICIFGDASFDFKNRIPNNTNVVPAYHALYSFDTGERSFVTDDFFGMLNDDEGLLDAYGSPVLDLGGIDVAVGRIIANDASQADELVMKVIDYHDLKSYGGWRNNYVLISDDADKESDVQLQTRQNQLATDIAAAKPFLNLEKIYLDSYEQETAAGGARYPKARQDMFNAFEKGALVFNYLGHGGEDGLSAERVWIKEDGQNLSNRYKYPLFITITCEFSRFDNPYRPTAGEYTFWNPRGGAVSMITTVRSIGQGAAQDFNDTLSEYLLSYVNGNSTNTYVSIAEALRQAKSASIGIAINTNIITFLGDPAMMLAVPKPQIRLTAVNDAPITGPIDDFQSLDHIKLNGEVTDEFNTPLPNYNGEISVTVFDKNIQRTTLDNDNMNSVMNFITLGETIFRGNATVANGQFQVGFVVPRDIRIPLGNGRISFYSKRNQILLDKTGYDTTIKVGGINTSAAEDNIGPTVQLYMNDRTFVNGGITNENPIFLAFLEDENGINTASGIGHDIIAILDGDEANPYIMNDYYEAELDNYKKGQVRYPFRNLAKGLHTITFKAWDVYNNPIVAEIQFVVVGDDKITLTNVLNYPNPFTTYTQFWFSHNKPFEPLDVQVQVMTVTGKVVWTKNQVVNTDGFLSREVTWDGKDDFGDRIGKGVYIYKLTVRSTLTNTKSEKIEKLVIL